MIDAVARVQSRINEIQDTFRKYGFDALPVEPPKTPFSKYLNDAIDASKVSDSEGIENSIEVKNTIEMNNNIDKETFSKLSSLNTERLNNALMSAYTVDMIEDGAKLPALGISEDIINKYRKLSSSYSSEYDGIITEASKKYNVPEDLIKAVIKQESNYSKDAISSKGAVGLMQIMPDTATTLGIDLEKLNDPYTNIMGGTKYLSSMLERYDGRLDLSLSAYNAGPNLVDKLQRIPNIAETQNYVKNIINYLR